MLAGLADGSVDVVIGTHRLLNPATKVKNLGLVIVDEEQRFGVEHKEHLKALRTNVDVLTMSATPIPRTLEMAVTGIREMSTIATPPDERLPVLTFVGPYNERQVAAAIRRELTRDGQVFFLHNRVESIDRVAPGWRRWCRRRIAVAHGQMHESDLERVMVDFWERSFDVLVCTTIVESGLDIPNANTLIVDRAERFGLSQLHQIRGRVGRGRERAYAYFFYDADKPMTETAYERLSTIAAHTDLGAGMAVAMKDLEIRGAGNLLGGQQSGHIADVGFDLYVRMVGEAPAEVKGEAEPEAPVTRVELPTDAHIPRSYLPDERLRLEAYRRLAEAADQQAVDEVVAELADRYGRAPEQVEALIAAARLRIRLAGIGVTEAVQAGSRIRIVGLSLRSHCSCGSPGSTRVQASSRPARPCSCPRRRPLESGQAAGRYGTHDVARRLRRHGDRPASRPQGGRVKHKRLALLLASGALLAGCGTPQAGSAVVGHRRITDNQVAIQSDALAADLKIPLSPELTSYTVNPHGLPGSGRAGRC